MTVFERNRASDAFGFGVVFSDETLTVFEHADPESYCSIAERFARWTDVDIHHCGTLTKSGGHGFAALGRRELLAVLQERALSLGVELRYECEAPPVSELGWADLIVGADGASSAVRTQLYRDFVPTVEPRHCRYMWLGTDLVFDSVKFFIEETSHGVFQAHAYPYDEQMSTFIVETHEHVWRAAGLDALCVSDIGRITPGCAGMYRLEQVEAWRRIVEFAHTYGGCAIGAQIGHSGRKGSTKLMWDGIDEPLPSGNWPAIGPSPLPYTPSNQVPREMTRADLDAVRDQFVWATRDALAAGFDLLELHCAHGYLLSSFLSPLTNVREDEYGGCLENRARYPLEVFDACRAVWPDSKPISVRLSATDWVDGGFDPDQAVAFALMLQDHGCDIVDVSSGQVSPLERPAFGRSYQTPFADRIRNEVGIPTIAVGAIASYDDLNTIVLAGRADLWALARPHIYDPHWTLHAAAEQDYGELEWVTQYRAGSRKPPAGRG